MYFHNFVDRECRDGNKARWGYCNNIGERFCFDLLDIVLATFISSVSAVLFCLNYLIHVCDQGSLCYLLKNTAVSHFYKWRVTQIEVRYVGISRLPCPLEHTVMALQTTFLVMFNIELSHFKNFWSSDNFCYPQVTHISNCLENPWKNLDLAGFFVDLIRENDKFLCILENYRCPRKNQGT